MARAENVENGDPDGRCCETDMEAPEGGWSWLIVLAIAISKMAFWGVLPCFGLVFVDVLDTFPEKEGTSVASVIGIFSICLDLTGLSCVLLYRFMSFRQVAVLGGVIFVAGSLGASFSTSVAALILTYGGVQGVGFGMMSSANMASFNEHFRRRRTTAMAVAQVVNGVGTVALPLATQALQAASGPRTAKLLLAAIGIAAAASQLLLHAPPPPPQRPPPAQQERRERVCLELNTQKNGVGTDLHQEIDRPRCGVCVRGVCARAWQLTGLRAEVVRDPVLLLVAAGAAVVNVADRNFFAMLPLHLRALRLHGDNVATLIFVSNAGEFAGRLLLVAAGRWLARRNRLIFALASFTSAAAVLVLTLEVSWTPILVLVLALGVCRGMLYVTLFLTMAEIVNTENFPGACALHFLLHTLFSMSISPLLGEIRDVTGNFSMCFRVVALLFMCPIMWGLEVFLRVRPQCQRSKVDNADNPAQPILTRKTRQTTGQKQNVKGSE